MPIRDSLGRLWPMTWRTDEIRRLEKRLARLRAGELSNPATKACAHCRKRFTGSRSDAKFCSGACRQASHRVAREPREKPKPKKAAKAGKPARAKQKAKAKASPKKPQPKAKPTVYVWCSWLKEAREHGIERETKRWVKVFRNPLPADSGPTWDCSREDLDDKGGVSISERFRGVAILPNNILVSRKPPDKGDRDRYWFSSPPELVYVRDESTGVVNRHRIASQGECLWIYISPWPAADGKRWRINVRGNVWFKGDIKFSRPGEFTGRFGGVEFSIPQDITYTLSYDELQSKNRKRRVETNPFTDFFTAHAQKTHGISVTQAQRSLGLQQWPTTRKAVEAAFRRAAKTSHPDHGGDARKFKVLVKAKKLALALVTRDGGGQY